MARLLGVVAPPPSPFATFTIQLGPCVPFGISPALLGRDVGFQMHDPTIYRGKLLATRVNPYAEDAPVLWGAGRFVLAGNPITSLEGLCSNDSGDPEYNIYRIPLGPEGALGRALMSFWTFEGRLYLCQPQGNFTCPWMGIVNGYQSVAFLPRTREQLLDGYRVVMERFGKPLQHGYDINDDLGPVIAQFGSFYLEGVSAPLELGAFRLLFENGGTRVVTLLPDGRVQFMNFFEPVSVERTKVMLRADYDTQYGDRYPSIQVTADHAERVLGIESKVIPDPSD